MAELQQPEFVSWNGKLIPWANATVHIDSPATKRTVSIFEGLLE